MNRSSWSAWIALAVLAPLPGTKAEERPRPVVIRGCSVLDVASGTMLADRTVVLEEGKVRAIGTPEIGVDTRFSRTFGDLALASPESFGNDSPNPVSVADIS